MYDEINERIINFREIQKNKKLSNFMESFSSLTITIFPSFIKKLMR